MAMALMLQELNAENFSSGNAADGDALTADGLSGSSWRKPAGLLVLTTSDNWMNDEPGTGCIAPDIAAAFPFLLPPSNSTEALRILAVNLDRYGLMSFQIWYDVRYPSYAISGHQASGNSTWMASDRVLLIPLEWTR